MSRRASRGSGWRAPAIVGMLGLFACRASAQTAPAQPSRAETPTHDAAPRAPSATPDAQGAAAVDESTEVLDARASFLRGVELASAGAWQDALSAFERSARLRPHSVTTYDIAFCEQKLGHLTRALHAYEAALSEGAARDGSRLPPELEEKAAKALAEIDPVLATARVSVGSVETQVLVDGRPLTRDGRPSDTPVMLAGVGEPGAPETVVASSFVVRLDPGTHVFRFFSPGHGSRELVRSAAASEAITVDAAEPEAKPSRASNAVGSGAPERTHGRALPYTSLAVGGAALAVGSTFGVLALVKRSNLSSACGGETCPPEHAAEVRELGTYADVATVLLVVGGAGVALGTILLLTEDHGRAPAPGPQQAVITIGPSSLTVRASF